MLNLVESCWTRDIDESRPQCPPRRKLTGDITKSRKMGHRSRSFLGSPCLALVQLEVVSPPIGDIGIWGLKGAGEVARASIERFKHQKLLTVE